MDVGTRQMTTSATLPGSSEPISSSSDSARAALIVTADSVSSGVIRRFRQAAVIASGRLAVGDVPGLKSVPERDRDAALDEGPGRGVVLLHQEPGRRRQERRDDRLIRGRGRGEGVDPGGRWRREVVGRRGPELGGEFRAARRDEFVGMEPRRQPVRRRGLQDPPGLVRR